MRGDFTEQAGAYAAARPTYPDALIDRLIARAGVAKDDAIADVGAGTGLFTRALAQRGFTKVCAIEPNAAMRAQAGSLAGVRWSEGTFESTGLGSASQRWIAIAHAFHWADPRRALPELRRVLEPKRALTVLFNVRDDDASDVLRFTRARIEAMTRGFDEGYRDRAWAEVLTSTGDFERPEEDEERHAITMSADRYLTLWRSHHLLTRAIGEDGIARLVRELGGFLGGRAVQIPYRCRSWTVWSR